MDAACKIGQDVLLIPRIKLDPPYDWLKNHPEEVFVYYGGPRTAEEISAMVGFANRQSFYAAFYRIVGETPNGYRKRMLTEKSKK